MPRASVVHVTSTATRPQHMSQVTHAPNYNKKLIKKKIINFCPQAAIEKKIYA